MLHLLTHAASRTGPQAFFIFEQTILIVILLTHKKQILNPICHLLLLMPGPLTSIHYGAGNRISVVPPVPAVELAYTFTSPVVVSTTLYSAIPFLFLGTLCR